jgi:sec-independent protein translocase protein TatB
MFDLSFFELVVIGVVALVVIGPEKLPKVARTLGALTGRAQRYVTQVKEEVNREVRFEELQKLQDEIKSTINKTQTSMRNEFKELSDSIVPVEKTIVTDKAADLDSEKQLVDSFYEDELYMTMGQNLNEEGQSVDNEQPQIKVRKKRTVNKTVKSKVEPT